MESLYTISATAVDGRDGYVKSESGLLGLDLKPSREMGGPGGATHPEELFAAGYAACFTGALNLVALLRRISTGEVRVNVTVTQGKTAEGTFQLQVRIDAHVPGVTPEVARSLTEETHEVCPYSRATHGNIEVELHATVA